MNVAACIRRGASLQRGMAAGLADLQAPIDWLAWRDSRVEGYEPPRNRGDAAAARVVDSPSPPPPPMGASGVSSCHALVVCGSTMAEVPIDVADLFVDVLHPAGCQTVVLSGGVGRGTLSLWRELVEKGLAHEFTAVGWPGDTQPASVALRAQGGEKPVLAAADDVPQDLAERRRFCCEADVMLELFCRQVERRGMEVRFGGDPMADGRDLRATAEGEAARSRGVAFVYLESASTNSGANCQLSSRVVVGNARHGGRGRRHGGGGAHPGPTGAPARVPYVGEAGWTAAPRVVPRANGEQPQWRDAGGAAPVRLGELRRIQAYAEPSKEFLVIPPDFPCAFVEPLASLEPELRRLILDGLREGRPMRPPSASLPMPTGDPMEANSNLFVSLCEAAVSRELSESRQTPPSLPRAYHHAADHTSHNLNGKSFRSLAPLRGANVSLVGGSGHGVVQACKLG